MNSKSLFFTPATPQDIPLLQSIAQKTWPDTFAKILSPDQINYMLELMYNTTTLTEQIKKPHYHYYLINKTDGLAALELHYKHGNQSKLHKLYILPEKQGIGLGVKTLQELETISKAAGNRTIILNVNKINPATDFYEKCGFTRWKSEVIDIGQGYVMDDYVYRKEI